MLRIVRKLLHPTAQLCRMNTFDACAYDTPRCLISRTASSLNSRVNCLLSMTHLLFHKTPNSVSSEPGAAQSCNEEFELKSQKGRFGTRVVDGAFKTKCERLAA